MFVIKKRAAISVKISWLIRLLSVLTALLILTILLLIMHYQPIAVFLSMITGAFGSKLFIQETIKITIPLLITALGVGMAFKMKLWNIGGEGQILMGGVCAMAVAIYADGLPKLWMLILMGIAGFAGGGLWGLIPGVCKAKWNTNETLLTLMLNYVALKFVILLQNTKSWQDEANSYPKIRMLMPNARLPKLMGVHIGWIIALLLVAVYIIYMNYTRYGYELKVVGDSHNTARYAGISVKRVILRTMFISAGLCGLAGFLQVSGADGTLSENTASGMGFTAITVAWMAGIDPVGMLIVAMLISALERGASYIQTEFLIPQSFAQIMTGIILLCIMGSEFFIRYQVSYRRKENAD